jgi:hypothetical protein
MEQSLKGELFNSKSNTWSRPELLAWTRTLAFSKALEVAATDRCALTTTCSVCLTKCLHFGLSKVLTRDGPQS